MQLQTTTSSHAPQARSQGPTASGSGEQPEGQAERPGDRPQTDHREVAERAHDQELARAAHAPPARPTGAGAARRPAKKAPNRTDSRRCGGPTAACTPAAAAELTTASGSKIRCAAVSAGARCNQSSCRATWLGSGAVAARLSVARPEMSVVPGWAMLVPRLVRRAATRASCSSRGAGRCGEESGGEERDQPEDTHAQDDVVDAVRSDAEAAVRMQDEHGGPSSRPSLSSGGPTLGTARPQLREHG